MKHAWWGNWWWFKSDASAITSTDIVLCSWRFAYSLQLWYFDTMQWSNLYVWLQQLTLFSDWAGNFLQIEAGKSKEEELPAMRPFKAQLCGGQGGPSGSQVPSGAEPGPQDVQRSSAPLAAAVLVTGGAGISRACYALLQSSCSPNDINRPSHKPGVVNVAINGQPLGLR
jgi:hypothetical protein